MSNGTDTTARAIVAKVHEGVAAALRSPDVVRRMSADGAEPVGSSPAEFGAYIKSEVAKWSKLVKDARLDLK